MCARKQQQLTCAFSVVLLQEDQQQPDPAAARQPVHQQHQVAPPVSICPGAPVSMQPALQPQSCSLATLWTLQLPQF